MQKLILLLAGFLLFSAMMMFMHGPKSNSDEIREEYKLFQLKYNKFGNEEFRYAIFQENYLKIQEHNMDSTQTYIKGVNQFADLTQDEFEQTYLMMDLPAPEEIITLDDIERSDVANDIDWRTKGAVTPVKNQGSCGSCWSFSTTGAIEGALMAQAGKLPNLSEQQLVDCCIGPKYKCQGCRGAWPDWAMDYVKDNGITTQSDYPYKGRQEKCQKPGGDTHIKSYAKLAATESALTEGVNAVPVSICLNASQWGAYKGGILGNCAVTPLNHAVLLVGYTSTYWIVKNSWGTQWGEQGYIKLARPGNTCGLCNYSLTIRI